MGVTTGFFSDGAACPAYPWPQDGAQGGRKVFMQSDCAACHSMLPFREAAPQTGEAEPKLAEIVVVNDEQQPAFQRPVNTTMLQGLRRNNLYTAEALKTPPPPTPVCLQFLQPYMRTHQAA